MINFKYIFLIEFVSHFTTFLYKLILYYLLPINILNLENTALYIILNFLLPNNLINRITHYKLTNHFFTLGYF